MTLDLGQSTIRHPGVDAAIQALAQGEGTESRGVIYTKFEVVEFILDMVGYTTDRPLHTLSMMEPSCGDGDFLIAIVDRLLIAYQKHCDKESDAINDLSASLVAVEIHSETCADTKRKIGTRLRKAGISQKDATYLTEAWFRNDDFLLTSLGNTFDFIVGNPPYVRQENIPNILLEIYRKQFFTMYDRADLYVPFIERSLDLLNPSGVLGFICADRWMKNKYGKPLRSMIDRSFHLRHHIDLTNAQPFHREVTAYPAISIIAREDIGPTRVVTTADVSKKKLKLLSTDLLKKNCSPESVATEIFQISDGEEPWLLEHPERINILRKIEAAFPKLEEVGCKVGIGVATGADKAFIGDFESLPVEQDRKLPLASTKDLKSGEIAWHGLGVVNPYKKDGGLVDLEEYPLLQNYLQQHYDDIVKRHCAKRNRKQWYKTIDRINPNLAKRPKLLIPDINGEARVVYEDGYLYPHHNLYYIVSDCWDLRALQAVLLSKITQMVIGLYTTKMRGGYPRYQAQYLRRIRLPAWDTVPSKIRDDLIVAACSKDLDLCTHVSCNLYKLSTADQKFVTNLVL